MNINDKNRLNSINGYANMSDINSLTKIADAIDKTHRDGNDEDVPEGSRYITISDTLAKEVSTILRALANKIHRQMENE